MDTAERHVANQQVTAVLQSRVGWTAAEFVQPQSLFSRRVCSAAEFVQPQSLFRRTFGFKPTPQAFLWLQRLAVIRSIAVR